MKKVFICFVAALSLSMVLGSCKKKDDVTKPAEEQEDQKDPTPDPDPDPDPDPEPMPSTLNFMFPVKIFNGMPFKILSSADDVTFTCDTENALYDLGDGYYAIDASDSILVTGTSPTQGTKSMKVATQSWNIYYKFSSSGDWVRIPVALKRQELYQLWVAAAYEDEDAAVVLDGSLAVTWVVMGQTSEWKYGFNEVYESSFEYEDMADDYISKTKFNMFVLEQFQKEYETEDKFVIKAIASEAYYTDIAFTTSD